MCALTRGTRTRSAYLPILGTWLPIGKENTNPGHMVAYADARIIIGKELYAMIWTGLNLVAFNICFVMVHTVALPVV